ncbi:hypothetical protein D3C87_1747800 [compost metagenome]
MPVFIPLNKGLTSEKGCIFMLELMATTPVQTESQPVYTGQLFPLKAQDKNVMLLQLSRYTISGGGVPGLKSLVCIKLSYWKNAAGLRPLVLFVGSVIGSPLSSL